MKNKKGGRPRAQVKRNRQITVVTNLFEFKAIEFNAKIANLSKSEYLRDLGIRGEVILRVTSLPKEILNLVTELNQANSLLNQIAKTRNRNETLTFKDKLELKSLIVTIQVITEKLLNTETK